MEPELTADGQTGHNGDGQPEPDLDVESADHLVAEATDDLARILASHRASLQAWWRREDNVDTEQLRVVFRSYRTFLLGLLDT